MVRLDNKSIGNPQQEDREGVAGSGKPVSTLSLHGSSEQATRETLHPMGWAPWHAWQELVAAKVLSAWRPWEGLRIGLDRSSYLSWWGAQRRRGEKARRGKQMF